jgi:hypothetical protein
MDIRGDGTIRTDSFLTQRAGGRPSVAENAPRPNLSSADAGNISTLPRDLVVYSGSESPDTRQTRLLKDTTEAIDKGFRRTQTFERADGRNFTRIEEFTVSQRNARRIVIQQNASGNTTRLDEVFEKQDNGTFRHVQRFTDEGGDTSTTIAEGLSVVDPFILSGGQLPPAPRNFPFQSALRGTQLDLHA